MCSSRNDPKLLIEGVVLATSSPTPLEIQIKDGADVS